MNIEKLYLQAELAQAAYALDLFPGVPDTKKLTASTCGMTETQAEAFAKQWIVIDQYTEPPLTGSGFSATVFQYIGKDIGDLKNGQYVFAVRGTEPSGSQLIDDLLDADFANIGYEGFSLKQALDLYNYQKSLVTTYGESYQAVYLETDGLGKCSHSL